MRIVLILATALVTSSSGAAELWIPLPELIGNYELSTFDVPQPPSTSPRSRTTQIQSALPISNIKGLRFELTGSISSGSAIGDGVFRQPVSTPLRGSFAPSFLLGNFGLSWLYVAEESDGPLQTQFEFAGGFYFPFLPDVPYFDPAITLSLAPGTSSFTNVGYFVAPDGGFALPDLRGMEITTPMTGEITSAYLVLQVVPEPPSSVLFCITIAVLVMFKRFPISVNGILHLLIWLNVASAKCKLRAGATDFASASACPS